MEVVFNIRCPQVLWAVKNGLSSNIRKASCLYFIFSPTKVHSSNGFSVYFLGKNIGCITPIRTSSLSPRFHEVKQSWESQFESNLNWGEWVRNDVRRGAQHFCATGARSHETKLPSCRVGTTQSICSTHHASFSLFLLPFTHPLPSHYTTLHYSKSNLASSLYYQVNKNQLFVINLLFFSKFIPFNMCLFGQIFTMCLDCFVLSIIVL